VTTDRPRGAFGAALLLAVATLAGCASGGGNAVLTPPPKPTPTPTIVPVQPQVVYTAIGASDAVGYGASKPCTTVSPPTGAADPTCLGITGTGYVPLLARRLQTAGDVVTLDDLGISGAVLGPDILATVNAYGSLSSATPCVPPNDYPTDFLTAELPKVSAASTLVTIFAGGNDTIGLINAVGCGAGGTTLLQQVAYLDTQIAAFGSDLAKLVGGIKKTAPKAKIVIANLPNFALIPVGLQQTAAAQQGLAYLSTQLDAQVINPLAATGVAVVDLLCNPASYVATNFYTDGFHPNDAGYAVFEAGFYAQISAAAPVAPAATCSYATAQARLRQPISGPLRHI
jgi:lysophospholipase L1-like esterase